MKLGRSLLFIVVMDKIMVEVSRVDRRAQIKATSSVIEVNLNL